MYIFKLPLNIQLQDTEDRRVFFWSVLQCVLNQYFPSFQTTDLVTIPRLLVGC